MIEPTESESREEFDLFIDAMRQIAREVDENPELVTSAPHSTRISRLDETTAARKPILRWKAPAASISVESIPPRKSGSLSVRFHHRRDELEKYEFMMGPARGKLAVSLDMLTDALILVGQHGVYCTSQRNPSKPALDLDTVLEKSTARNNSFSPLWRTGARTRRRIGLQNN